jgi:hypothetical protein
VGVEIALQGEDAVGFLVLRARLKPRAG